MRYIKMNLYVINIKEGEIVHIKVDGGYWIGKIISVAVEYKMMPRKYAHPIALIEGLDKIGCAHRVESELMMKDGEWWDKK